MEGDAIYFSRRASEERAAAMKSSNRNARESHLQMAARYDELVSAIETHHARVGAQVSG